LALEQTILFAILLRGKTTAKFAQGKITSQGAAIARIKPFGLHDIPVELPVVGCLEQLYGRISFPLRLTHVWRVDFNRRRR
jgi:hypothetical protein